MARDFTAASSHQLSVATPALTSNFPITIAAWIYANSTADFQDVAGVYGDPGVGEGAKGSRLTVDAGPIRFTQNFGPFSYADSTADITANTWHHACGVAYDQYSRAAFLDGGNKGEGFGSADDGAEHATRIGGRFDDASFFDGRICEVAMWNAALTDAEVAALATGLSPLKVRPDALASYWPLWGRYSPEIDVVASLDLTVTGAVVAPHAPVIYPALPIVGVPGGAAPPGNAMPQAVASYRRRRAG